MPKARLRTKTGCSTCRQRKVKCGEQRPICGNCVAAARDCSWPSADDLQDRPFRAVAGRSSASPRRLQRAPTWEESSILSMGNREMPELEHDLTYHYLNVLLSTLLLPTASEADVEDYGTQIMSMMMSSNSVKFAILANCASNKYMLTKECRYHNTAFTFYSKAIELVKRSLHDLSSTHESPDDELLTTVVYLYLYNFWGSDTALDATKHVDGAVSLLKLRYEDQRSPLSMTQTLHRVAMESVIYQAFLLAARKPFASTFHIDSQFLAQSENILLTKGLGHTLFTDSTLVLGIPLPLYRLTAEIIDFLNSPEQPRAESTARLLEEIKPWEHFVLAGATDAEALGFPTTQSDFQTEAITLFVLAASLLLDYINESSISATSNKDVGLLGITGGAAASSPGSTRWQVAKAFSILRRPEAYRTWTRCYLGAWPMLILGYSVDREEDAALIRLSLTHMRDRMGYGEIQRILDDLEAAWSMRLRRSDG